MFPFKVKSPSVNTGLLGFFLLAVLLIAASRIEVRSQSISVPMLTESDRVDLIPGSEVITSSNLLSGNNQIVREGRYWAVVFDGTDGQIWMSFAQSGRAEGRDFRRAVPVVGKANAPLTAQADASHGNLLLDRDGRLHLFWQEAGLKHAICEDACLASPEKATMAGSWKLDDQAAKAAPGLSDLGDVWLDPTGGFWVCYTAADGIHVASARGRAWESKRIAPGSHPSAFLDSQGTLHLVFEQDRRISYTRILAAQFKTTPLESVAYGLIYYPALVLVKGHPLVVYQVEGIKRRPLSQAGEAQFIPARSESRSSNYNEAREGGGASIAYAFRDEHGWRRGYVSRAEEILVRIASINDTNSGGVQPMVEEEWHPVLTIDRHGVPWVFWSNTTRLHTYFSRWLGEGFSEPLECRGPFYGLSWAVRTERHPPFDASDIGVLTVASGRLYFGRVPVPPLEVNRGKTFPVLDLLSFSEVVGLKHRLGAFERYAGNPILGGPDRPKEERATFPHVRFDGKKFWMEFNGADLPAISFPPLANPANKPPSVSIGRWASRHRLAVSEDGLRWERPRSNVFRYEGPASGDHVYWVTYLRDEAEPDSSRRFKGILGEGHWINNDERLVVYSPDGFHWTAAGKAVNAEFMMEQGGPSYRDPYDIDERRFKSICRSIGIFGGRALGMMYSPDLIHWGGAEPRLTPGTPYAGPRTTPMFWRGRLLPHLLLDSLGERSGEQIYWGTVWLENGIYMCLYAPMPYDGGYEVSLAASRDGLHFYRIKHGARILPRGPAGEWDSGSIASTSVPILRGDELWYYYGGRMRHHGVEQYKLDDFDGIGLAKLRRDGWAYLEPSNSSAGRAYATTVPFDRTDVEGKRLFLNLSGVGSGKGAIRAEVLDATSGTPLPGFGGADSATINTEGTAVLVNWRNPSLLVPETVSRVKFRFWFEGPQVQLYAFAVK